MTKVAETQTVVQQFLTNAYKEMWGAGADGSDKAVDLYLPYFRQVTYKISLTKLANFKHIKHVFKFFCL